MTAEKRDIPGTVHVLASKILGLVGHLGCADALFAQF